MNDGHATSTPLPGTSDCTDLGGADALPTDACLVCTHCGSVLATLTPAVATRAAADRARTAVPLRARIPLLASMFVRELVAPLRFVDRSVLCETGALVPVPLFGGGGSPLAQVCGTGLCTSDLFVCEAP